MEGWNQRDKEATQKDVQFTLAIIYLAFISLGLPDALLGSAWPTMYREFGVPVSYAGGISMIIAVGTIVSTCKVTALRLEVRHRQSNCCECRFDRDCFVWILDESVLLVALFVGHSVWAWCRRSGCVTE